VIVLGIDPGTASLGYGLVDRTGSHLRAIDFGVFSTGPDLPLPDRLLAIHTFLEDLIELHAPTLLGVERIFHTRNVQTALAVGHARGVVLLAAAAHDLAVREATPNEVKLAVTGYGSADKGQVARMVAAILGLPEPPQPDDAADALAVAIWTANRERAGERINAGILDRGAVAPRRAGESPYERAVREALGRDLLGGQVLARKGLDSTPDADSTPVAAGAPARLPRGAARAGGAE
jgi:crossover junction endodeoxyribonuclease RuvC